MEKFTEQIKAFAKRVETLKGSIETEEATKTAVVMPFFQILGYDIFNPLEFNPEFTADVGIKKGEKVDYAILQDGLPMILIECKSINQKLTKHDSQLFRYFGTTTAKFSILTNGIEYKFFTDLEVPNKMDTTPFFTFKIDELRDIHVAEIAKFRKEAFDVDKITSNASELKYLNALKGYLVEQFDNPSEDFVRFLVGEIYEGVKTKAAIEKFTPIVKRGLKLIVNDQVNDKLNAALNSTNENKVIIEEPVVETPESDGIVTTNDELECYAITKVILKDAIELERVFFRDNKSYFNILIDDSIRKWIMRVYLDRNRNYIVLNNAPTDRDRSIIEIEKPIDLLMYKEQIITTALSFK